jgi:DNA mismatch repair protein MLH3
LTVKKRTHQSFQPLDRPKEYTLDLGPDENGAARGPFQAIASCNPSTSVRFTNDDLRRSKVIAQVDNKFICCSITRDAQHGRQTQHIVLFDQHAADERVRVEQYLDVLSKSFASDTVDIRDLSLTPLLILLPDYQSQWLTSSRIAQGALRRWGFGIDLPLLAARPSDARDNAAYAQISVFSVPAIVHERLSAQHGKEAQKTIQSYVEFLMQEGTSGLHTLIGNLDAKHGGEGPAASAILRWCPRRLLELVNSKACRGEADTPCLLIPLNTDILSSQRAGAIMFNDPLTMSQCQRLMRKLAYTEFPFICAHGRPSLAPLVEYVGRESSTGNSCGKIDWSKVDLGG